MAGKEQLRLEKGSFWKLGAWKPGRRRELLGAEVEMRFGEMHGFVSAGKGNGE
jgi:hypothetical protein